MASAQAAHVTSAPLPQGGRRALGILTALNVFNYMDRFVGAAVLPLIIRDLHLTDTEAGLVSTVFILSYAMVSPIVGVLGDRRRRLPLAAAGVLLWSVATVASGLAPSFGIFLFVRALIGVGEASYSVVTPSLLSDYFPPERRGRAMALFYGAMPVGAALGYIVGGQVGAVWGWRAAFFIAGVPGAVLAIALLFLREPPRGGLDPAPLAPPVPLSGLSDTMRALVRRPSFLYNVAAQTIYTFAMGGLAHWMPTFLERERSIPLAQASSTFGALLVVAGFVGTLLGGQLGDHLARRLRGAHFSVSGFTLCASLPFSAAAILSPAPAIFWPAMFVTLLLLFVNVAPLNAAMANVLPADLRARGFAVNTLVIHLLGDALSPTLIGRASDSVGLLAPVLATGLFLAVGGVVLLAGRRALDRDMGAVA